MILTKITVQVGADPIELAFQRRRLVALLRMRAAGIRHQSARRYLARAFPNSFVRAMRAELLQLARDIMEHDLKWWVHGCKETP